MPPAGVVPRSGLAQTAIAFRLPDRPHPGSGCEPRVRQVGVVIANPARQADPQFGTGFECIEIDALVFERSPQAFMAYAATEE